MKKSFRDIVAMRLARSTSILLGGLSIVVLSCNPPPGACTVGSGITRSCGDDFTSGQCGLINGTFYEGLTCADLSLAVPVAGNGMAVDGRGFHLAFQNGSGANRRSVSAANSCVQFDAQDLATRD